MENRTTATLMPADLMPAPPRYAGTKPPPIPRQVMELQRTLEHILLLAGTAARQNEKLSATGLAENPDLYRDALHFHARLESIAGQTEDALRVLTHIMTRYRPTLP